MNAEKLSGFSPNYFLPARLLWNQSHDSDRSKARAKSILRVAPEMVTPHGLRTLAPSVLSTQRHSGC